MPQSIPKGLTAEYVLHALGDLDGGLDHPFGAPPKGYELVHDGKRYQPKAVIDLAYRHRATPPALKVQRRRGPWADELRPQGTWVRCREEGDLHGNGGCGGTLRAGAALVP